MRTLQVTRLVSLSAVALAVSVSTASAQAPAGEPKGPVAKPLLNLDLAPRWTACRAASCVCN